MKVIYVDFKNQPSNKEIEHEDPVMRRIQKKLDPQWWETYKRTIEHYWKECFIYQMEVKDGKMYDSNEIVQEKHEE